MGILLVGATTAEGGTIDVRIDAGRIAAVGALERLPDDEVHDLTGYVLLPAPAEPHAHLDKALTADRVVNRTGDLLGAIEAWHAAWPTLTKEDIIQRARRAALSGVANGLTAIRSHGDLSSVIGLRSMEALVEVREELRDLVDIQVVALTALPTAGLAGADHRALLRDAARPWASTSPEGARTSTTTASAASKPAWRWQPTAGRPIDLHVDETLDPEVLGLRDFARLVSRTGFPHGATASHCVSLGMQEEYVQKAVAAEVAEAGMAVVTLPQTNLFLQGHGHVTGMPRGLTALAAPARRRCDPRGRRRQRAGPFQHDGPRRPARDCRAAGDGWPPAPRRGLRRGQRWRTRRDGSRTGVDRGRLAGRAARGAGDHPPRGDRHRPPRPARLPPWPPRGPDSVDHRLRRAPCYADTERSHD